MNTQTLDNAILVTLIERVDSVTSPEVLKALQGFIAAGTKHLICDCHATKYISSNGLRVLLIAAKEIKRAGGRLSLVCPTKSYAHEILQTAGFTNIIPVFETSEAAVAGRKV